MSYNCVPKEISYNGLSFSATEKEIVIITQLTYIPLEINLEKSTLKANANYAWDQICK